MPEVVLWGSHPRYAGGTLIRLTRGTKAHCRAERRFRVRQGGWTVLEYAEVAA